MKNNSAIAPGNPYYPYVLLYSPSMNRFIDYEWYVVHDVSTIFDTWQLDQWKRNGHDAILTAKDGNDYMIYYLIDEEDVEILDFINWSESFGIKWIEIFSILLN